MNDLQFHVRHEVTPDRVWDVLHAIAEGYDFEHVTQADRQLGRLRYLGLVTKDQKLTPEGEILCKLGDQQRYVAMELFHFLHYTLWCADNPVENTLSWTYSTYCDLLFDRESCPLDIATREALTSELNAQITHSDIFGPVLDQTKKGAVSLSVNSLEGIHHWLEKLYPPVIQEDKVRTFQRRTFCSPELLLMGIGLVISRTGADLAVDQLLTPERREMICRICLLDPLSFDRALDWMLPLFPEIIQPGTHAGGYGRFLRLSHLPNLQELLH